MSIGGVPASWRWPLIKSRRPPGWICELCGDYLGTWENESQNINRHIEICKDGEAARSVRYRDLQDATLEDDFDENTKRFSGLSMVDAAEEVVEAVEHRVATEATSTNVYAEEEVGICSASKDDEDWWG